MPLEVSGAVSAWLQNPLLPNLWSWKHLRSLSRGRSWDLRVTGGTFGSVKNALPET